MDGISATLESLDMGTDLGIKPTAEVIKYYFNELHFAYHAIVFQLQNDEKDPINEVCSAWIIRTLKRWELMLDDTRECWLTYKRKGKCDPETYKQWRKKANTS